MNVDDEEIAEEGDDMQSAEDTCLLENSGWSSRTRCVLYIVRAKCSYYFPVLQVTRVAFTSLHDPAEGISVLKPCI